MRTLLSSQEPLMIKDVMVLLEGNRQDDVRMATAAEIAMRFQSRIVGLS